MYMQHFFKCFIMVGFFFAGFVIDKKAKSFEISKNWYGNATITIGYVFQGYSGSLYNQYKEYKNNSNYNTNIINHCVDIGLGYSFNYKISNFLSLFIGPAFSGVFTIDADKIYEFSGENGKIHSLSYSEFTTFQAKMGATFTLNKTLSLSPYYLIGMNAVKLSLQNTDGGVVNISQIRVGMHTGVGLEATLYDKYIFGIEYGLAYNKMGEKFNNITTIAHSLEVKVGLSFS